MVARDGPASASASFQRLRQVCKKLDTSKSEIHNARCRNSLTEALSDRFSRSTREQPGCILPWEYSFVHPATSHVYESNDKFDPRFDAGPLSRSVRILVWPVKGGHSSTPTDGDITVAKYPHPYLYGGLQLNGGGYSPTAWVSGAWTSNWRIWFLTPALRMTRGTRQTTTQSTTMSGTTEAWTVISSTASTSCTSEAELRGINCQPPTTRSNPGIRASVWDATGSEKLFHSVGRWFTNCRGATI
jgi:hypothetical protein